MNVNTISNKYLILFDNKSTTDFKIKYKQASTEDCSQVESVCALAGLIDRIVSVEQPSNSREINSQNFRVLFSSGDKLLVRRCHRLKGVEKYNFLYKIFESFKKENVRAPEFYSSETQKPIYLETSDKNQSKTDQKACWVFFKYIEAVQLFSGDSKMLEEAAEQIGKMHVCLKKFPADIGEMSEVGSSLTTSEWESYKKILQSKENVDAYDRCFLENSQMIEEVIKFLEENNSLLGDSMDIQLIHFDLNSSNFILDEKMQIRIMDFDELRVGNIYTDIAFALHRLVTTCVEQGNKNLNGLITTFFENYRKGNPEIQIENTKLKVAMYDRALRNIKVNLSLKYIQNQQDWLSAIPLNLRRLQQAIALCELFT